MDVKSFVQVYYQELYSRECVAAMARFLTDDYVEHQYTAGFTKAGLRAYVEKRLAENPGHRMIIHHAIQEGDFVFLFVEENWQTASTSPGPSCFAPRMVGSPSIGAPMSSTKEPKERQRDVRWLTRQPGRRSWPEACRQVRRARRTRFRRAGARGFLESRTPDYKQHSPKGGDGRDGLVNILKKMKETGTKMIMLPKRTIVEGDFIVSHRLYDTSPPHPLVNRINTFDVFRLNADGKAVEHWDVMEDVPSADMLDKLF